MSPIALFSPLCKGDASLRTAPHLSRKSTTVSSSMIAKIFVPHPASQNLTALRGDTASRAFCVNAVAWKTEQYWRRGGRCANVAEAVTHLQSACLVLSSFSPADAVQDSRKPRYSTLPLAQQHHFFHFSLRENGCTARSVATLPRILWWHPLPSVVREYCGLGKAHYWRPGGRCKNVAKVARHPTMRFQDAHILTGDQETYNGKWHPQFESKEGKRQKLFTW